MAYPATTDIVFSFSLQAVYIALNNGDGTFGTYVRGKSTKACKIALKLISDQADGNAIITDVAAQVISAEVSLDTAGFEDDFLAVMMNVTPVKLTNDEYVIMGDQVRTKYFGLIAQTYPDQGDVLHFFPSMKVTSDISYNLEFGKIVVPQFKAMGIVDPNYHPAGYPNGAMWNKITRSVTGALDPIAFPPTLS